MLDVLVITQNTQLVNEVEKICAVTQATVNFKPAATEADSISAHTVLMDAELDSIINHPNVVIVTTGEPGQIIWQKAVATGAKYVAFLPDARPWLLENLTPKSNKQAHTIGVLGASGGLGASLLASFIAIHFAQSNQKVLLTELNPVSGGLDVLWGIESEKGMRWSHLSNELSQFLVQDVMRSIPAINGVSILSTDLAGISNEKSATDLIRALKTEVNIQIIDLPSPQATSFGELVNMCDELLIIVGSSIKSISAANQLVNQLPQFGKAKLIVRNLSGTNITDLNIAKTLNLQLIGQIPTELKLVEHLEQGLSPTKIPNNAYRKAVLEICSNLDFSYDRLAA